MNRLHKSDCEWEIWDEKMVKQLASGWRNPADLQLDFSSSETDRHWRLTQKVHSLIEGESILDVGCGMGHLFILVKDCFDYLGIDTSQAMLKTAREFFPEHQDKFQFGDAYDLSTLPTFDTVVATGVLLHLPDSGPVIEQLWSKARRCTILSMWIGETPHTETVGLVSLKELIQTLKTAERQVLKRLILRKEPKELIWRTLKGLILRRDNKGLILRRDTAQHLSEIFHKLEHLDRIEGFPFSNPFSGESNYIFKLWKERIVDD